jgi:hypothetical protein
MTTPWLLEGAIRGTYYCGRKLVTKTYNEAKPDAPAAVMAYWMDMYSKFNEWDTDNDIPEINFEVFKYHVGRKCIICSKEDSEILTLQQCIGCTTHCYCSQECLTTHW